MGYTGDFKKEYYPLLLRGVGGWTVARAGADFLSFGVPVTVTASLSFPLRPATPTRVVRDCLVFTENLLTL